MKRDTAPEKRKTYSLDPERARDLASTSIKMEGEMNRTVPRQSILDALVSLISTDPAVYAKVKKLVGKA